MFQGEARRAIPRKGIVIKNQDQPSIDPTAPPSAGDSVDGQTRMGASEDQVVRNRPPTGALSYVLGDQSDDPHDPAPNGELTPG
jgi:hypothetical protein